MNKTPQYAHRQREDREIVDFNIRNERKLLEIVKEYEPELDVDLEIVEIGETDPTIEQEKQRKRIGEVIINKDVDDLVNEYAKKPKWEHNGGNGA